MWKSLCRGGCVVLFSTLTILADGVPSIVFQEPLANPPTAVTTDASGRVIAVGAAYRCVAATNASLNSSTQFAISTDAGATWAPLSNLPCDQTDPYNFAIAPSSPPVLYAATLSSILKSSDNGRSWAPVTPVPLQRVSCAPDLDFVLLCSNTIDGFAVDSLQPSTLYAATGAGLFKSTDAGANWMPASRGLKPSISYVFYYLKIDPFHSGTIYTATSTGAYRSLDGAQTWEQYTIPASQGQLTVFFDPTRAGTIYATDQGQEPSLYRSDDAGGSWTRLGPAKYTLAFDPAMTGVIYALDASGIEKSIDGGNTWSVVLSPPASGPWNLGTKIAVDAFDPSVVLTTSLRSGDGGATWAPISITGDYYRDFAFDPSTPGRVFAVAQQSTDAFLAIHGSDGGLQFATYFGGKGDDWATAVATDGAGNIYVTGTTSSVDFPTTAGVVQPVLTGAKQAFVTKFSADGNLVYSTYLGGKTTSANSIAVDSAGEAIVAGASSGDMPGAQWIGDPAPDASFIAKLAPDGKSLVFARLFYGLARAVAVESGGNIDVVGYRGLIRLDPAGNVITSTSLRGPPYATVIYASVDRQNNIYIAGTTGSKDLPVTAGAYQTDLHSNCPYEVPHPLFHYGPPILTSYYIGDDVFVMKFNSQGEVIFSTYLGGSCDDILSGLTVDPSGNVWVTGTTNSNPFPQRGSFETGPAGPDYNGNFAAFKGFVSELDPSGSRLLFSSYVTGHPSWITSDDVGNIYFDYQGMTKLAGGGASPSILINSAGNAFGSRDGPLSPGEIAQITLDGFTPNETIDLRINPSSPLPPTLGGAQALFDGVAAPIMTVAPDRILCIVPYSIAGQKTTNVQVSFGGNVSNALTADVVATDPFLLSADGSGTGQAVARNQDGSLNSADHAAHAGEIVTFYYTGGGVTSPPSIPGWITGDTPPVPVALPIARNLQILSASELPGFVSGLFQLKTVSSGGGSTARTATISISPTQTLSYWVQ